MKPENPAFLKSTSFEHEGEIEMDTAELAINKLIILAILSRVPGITLNQLTTLSLETLYMDYFDFVTAYEELCRDNMASESVRKGEQMLDAHGRPVTRCDLTPAGQSVLTTLESRIPLHVRSYLAQVCSGWEKGQRQENALSATCDPDGNGFYHVRLCQNDGLKDLLDLNLTIPDKTMAKQICDRWKRHPQTIYLGLLSLLTGEADVGQDEQLMDHAFEPFLEDQPELETEGIDEKIDAIDPRQQKLFE